MYGYIHAYKPELKFREFDTYHACYCGLCDALHDRYGSIARWTVSYDMTFLVLLLSGLYEPEEQQQKRRCAAHPLKKQIHLQSDASAYAADVSILLYHEKCMDDWLDERKISRKAAADLLDRAYVKAKSIYPQKAQQISQQLDHLHEMEQNNEPNLELPAGCFGTLLGELFVWKQDEWADSLRKIGFYLGKYIYLLDAYDDLKKDGKNGCYNPLLTESKKNPAFHEDCEQLLQMMIAACTAEFERLPILKYADILRNILYAGVWQPLYQRKKEYTKQENSHESI